MQTSMESVGQAERRRLLGSIVSASVLAVLGIALGLASGSQMILFDGIFSVIGIGVSWLLLLASALVDRGPTRRYPFGREAATPLVIGVQGFVLLATLIYATVEAVRTILDGGSDVTVGLGVAYATVSVLASFAVYAWLRPVGAQSDLVAAEAAAWLVAGMRGLGMVVGFLGIGLLDGSSWSDVAPYVDPAMVIVTCVAFLPTPVRMIRTTIVELLEGEPADAVRRPALAAIAEVCERFGLAEPLVRMTKIGPKLYVEVDVVVSSATTVHEEDAVRAALRRGLEQLPYDIWLNVELSADPALLA